jgi:hypothetical protein
LEFFSLGEVGTLFGCVALAWAAKMAVVFTTTQKLMQGVSKWGSEVGGLVAYLGYLRLGS